MMYSLVVFIAGVFQIYEFGLFMRCFFSQRRVSGFLEILSYVGLFCATTLPSLLIGIPIITMLFSFSGCIFITFIYQGSYKKKILIGALAFALMSLAECIVAVISGYVKLNIFYPNESYPLFGIVCLPFVQFILILFARNLKNVRGGETVSTSFWIFSVALPIMSLFLFTIFYRQHGLKVWELVGCISVLFAINIFVFVLYNKQNEAFAIRKEKEQLELQNEYQHNQLELMNQMVDYSRQQNHDFLKHVSMIAFLHKKERTHELDTYLEELNSNVKFQQIYVATGNFVIDSVLNYKMHEAVAAGIQTQVVAKVPDQISLSIYDINILFTNLMDNSIEAVEKLTEKWIEVRIAYLNDRLIIKIKNPCDEVHYDENGRIITSKSDAEHHGYGLKTVEEIIEKYNGVFDTFTRDGCFYASACLFLDVE